MPEFLARLRQQETIGTLALEFLILTATRTGEVLGADRQVDLTPYLGETGQVQTLKAGGLIGLMPCRSSMPVTDIW
ncbi:hypothetical protein JYK14_10330 [Siccirubricoccus sp. KC 17139]|uniref:Tyr recombinase domain-containing protein n=1 Tax=Siccirubricoccus soli TaxID=2899147 RepID=A0ABT1D3P2_9PROT|nr:hypothetical protein [Siccirubricoccus soli]MCO6416556.1 hypothetical protein [Siccirubricoccus soli]MCP2682691.1 hypothetical protein [Siccirubricoccus soli]